METVFFAHGTVFSNILRFIIVFPLHYIVETGIADGLESLFEFMRRVVDPKDESMFST